MALRTLTIDEKVSNTTVSALLGIQLGVGSTSVPYIDGTVLEATSGPDDGVSGLQFRLEGRQELFFAPNCSVRVDIGEQIRVYVPVATLPNSPARVVAFQIVHEDSEKHGWTSPPYIFTNGRYTETGSSDD